MSSIAKSVAALRIIGDSLVPEEVTSLIGSEPTSSYRKGDLKRLPSGKNLIRKTGMWLLEVSDREPEDINAQVMEILAITTPDIATWRNLCQQYKIDLFCGLFMENSNEGICMSEVTLMALGERGIKIDFDIYAPTQEAESAGL